MLVSRPAKNDIIPIFIEKFTINSLSQIIWPEEAQKLGFLSWVESLSQGNEDWTERCDQRPRIQSKLGNWLWPKLDQFLQLEKIEHIILIPQTELFLYPLYATPFVPLNRNARNCIYPFEQNTIVHTPLFRL